MFCFRPLPGVKGLPLFSPFPFLIGFPRRVVGVDEERSSTIVSIVVGLNLGEVNWDEPQGGDFSFMDTVKGSSWSSSKNPSTRAVSDSALVGVLKDVSSCAMLASGVFVRRLAVVEKGVVSIVDRITRNSVHGSSGWRNSILRNSAQCSG